MQGGGFRATLSPVALAGLAPPALLVRPVARLLLSQQLEPLGEDELDVFLSTTGNGKQRGRGGVR